MPDNAKSPSLTLDPVAGSDLNPVVIKPDTYTMLGRAVDCDACLPHKSVSRKHAAILNRNGKWLITDLNSKHGTHLNAVRLTPEKPTMIAHDDLLRIGPFTFRVSLATRSKKNIATTNDNTPPGSVVETISVAELDSLVHQRLNLVIEGYATIYQAETEVELAQAVINLIIAGTGFPRAAILRWVGSLDKIEIIAFKDQKHDTTEGFIFSRSLLHNSITGNIVRLTQSTENQYGRSVEGLGISAALCAPLIVDSIVVGALYLDSRAGETSPYPDAAGFCHAVSQIASLAISNLKRLEMKRRQKIFDEDLKIAQEAQSYLLPPPRGMINNLQYQSRTRAGAIVGGDLFDIFPIDNHKTAICFGDITGHGIGAAILMTSIHAHLRALLLNCPDPATAVTESNVYLTRHSSDRMFASLWVAVFDDSDNTLNYVDAGHGHWFTCTKNETPVKPDAKGGLIIGVDHESVYENEHLTLNPGSRLILYSDGIPEQRDSDNHMFTNERLMSIIANSNSISDDVDNTFSTLEKFAGTNQFADDTTIASITPITPITK